MYIYHSDHGQSIDVLTYVHCTLQYACTGQSDNNINRGFKNLENKHQYELFGDFILFCGFHNSLPKSSYAPECTGFRLGNMKFRYAKQQVFIFCTMYICKI